MAKKLNPQQVKAPTGGETGVVEVGPRPCDQLLVATELHKREDIIPVLSRLVASMDWARSRLPGTHGFGKLGLSFLSLVFVAT